MLVITKLMGGLGNQLFQYAAARRLAHYRNAELRLDLSFLVDTSVSTHTPRPYELGRFAALKAFALSKAELHQFNQTTEAPCRLYNKARRLLGFSSAFLYLGEGEYFTPNKVILEGGPPAQLLHLEGYWQNENYFADIASLIRKELVFPAFEGKLNQTIAQYIQTSLRPTVSVHVRRGDYTQFTAFGMCSVDYYERAISYMNLRVHEPVFIVFSDDIAWARKNLPLPVDTEFINWNKGADSYNDMHLMSQCHHHIIANSSFSWWGAWLNSKPDKIVLCPHYWMASPPVLADQVVPETWVKL